jgi:hypothetical protein
MPHSELEWQLITDFLKKKGYFRQALKNLPEDDAHRLRIEACRYASSKLAEIESRAKFKHKIRFDT